ncbi:nuclease-related domain-containing protein [Virgibacillus oceani]
MLHKPRTISSELLTLRYLNHRTNLPHSEKQYFLHLDKGYKGELQFDRWTEKLQCDCLILNDLLLKVNNTTFQIDSTIITADSIYLYEVKNLEGDHIYDAQYDKFYKMPQREILNPLAQMARGEFLLSQLLFRHGFKIPIESSVVFINEEFTLYNIPPDKPIIFSSQLRRYFREFNSISTQLNKNHLLLAEKLASLHMKNSPYKQIPSYSYDQLRKGIACLKCKSFSIFIKKSKCVCEKCLHEEKISDAVLRAVSEFKLLFPEQKITTNIIYDWCQVVKSKRTIINILSQNFKVVGKYRGTHYNL